MGFAFYKNFAESIFLCVFLGNDYTLVLKKSRTGI